MTRHIQLPGQAEPNATQRIAAEVRARMRSNTDAHGFTTSNAAERREVAEAAEAAALVEQQTAEAAAAAQAAAPRSMAPNRAQGSSAGGQLPTRPDTETGPVLDRIRAKAADKADGLFIQPRH